MKPTVEYSRTQIELIADDLKDALRLSEKMYPGYSPESVILISAKVLIGFEDEVEEIVIPKPTSILEEYAGEHCGLFYTEPLHLEE